MRFDWSFVSGIVRGTLDKYRLDREYSEWRSSRMLSADVRTRAIRSGGHSG